MDKIGRYIVLLCSILNCQGVNVREKLEELLERRENNESDEPSRRFQYGEVGSILGAPSMASHLPQAEPILPGHTLIRPALGMLKSAIKFPHRDPDNGSGVYGNVNALGIKFDGRNERVLYSGFRRTGTPAQYIVIIPLKTKTLRPKFILSSVVLDLDENNFSSKKLLEALRKNKRHLKIIGQPKSANKQKREKGLLVKKIARPQPKPISQTNRSPSDLYGQKKPPNKKLIKKIDKPYHFPQINQNKKPAYPSLKKALRSVIGVDKKNFESFELSNPLDIGKTPIETHDEEDSRVDKNTWFWNSEHTFNHVNINQDAPELADLMPANVSNHVRNWWFFHQEDYFPFTHDQD